MICAVLMVLLSLVFVGTHLLLQKLFCFSPRTIPDLIAAVQKVDGGELNDLLDPLKEANLRTRISDIRPERARLLLEYLRRMAFNALLILRWAYAEEERYRSPGVPTDAEKERVVQAIVQTGIEFRLYALLTQARLVYWLVRNTVRLRPTRTLASLREIGDIDGLEMYHRLTETVCSFGLGYGGHTYRRMVVAFWGNELSDV